MKPILFLIALQTMLIASFAQTNTATSSTLYVHFGYGNGGTAVQILCTQAHIGDSILVIAADLRNIQPWNNWKLTGHIEQQREKLTADLITSSAAESQFYKGPVVLDKPFFAQGGAASGGAGAPRWFVVSTKAETQPVLDELKDSAQQPPKTNK